MDPTKDPYARHHEMVIYVREETDRLTIYCRKCGTRVHEFNNFAPVEDINGWAKIHRGEAKERQERDRRTAQAFVERHRQGE